MWRRCETADLRRPSPLVAVGKLSELLGGKNERTLEGSDRRRGIWWAFCGPALELKSGGRDAYRSAELSPFPTTTLSSRDGLAFGGRDRLAASQRFEPAEKHSCLARNRCRCRYRFETSC